MKKSDQWLTPPELVQSLGEFDLDPCTPIQRPWDTAKQHFNINDDGLQQQWFGRVWMNPPFSNIAPWMMKIAAHKNGIALVPNSSDTAAFHDHIFPNADSMLYIKGRIKFYSVEGVQAKHGYPGALVLIGYDELNSDMIADSGIAGHHEWMKSFFVISISTDTWKVAITKIFRHKKNIMTLSQIYDLVEKNHPDKVRKNQHYKAKIRQVLQTYFSRVSKGTYTSNN